MLQIRFWKSNKKLGYGEILKLENKFNRIQLVLTQFVHQDKVFTNKYRVTREVTVKYERS